MSASQPMAEPGREQRGQAPRTQPAFERPFEHLRRVLAAHGPQLARGPLLILTHKNPDPDALGGMAGLAFLLEKAFGLETEVAADGRIFRAENLAMVRELDLEARPYEGLDLSHYSGAFLVDTQPGFGHTQVPTGVPLLGVFDHHEPPQGGMTVEVPHPDVRVGVGATSAILYEYIRDAGLELDARTATALCCGIRFDTADLSIHVTELDREAFFETFRSSDRKKLARITTPSLPPNYYRELHRSLSRARRHGPLVFGFMGRVANPESVAEMADFFRRMEGCRWSFVGGAYEDKYHLSLRTDITYAEAYPLMEQILDGEGSFGGRGPVAGGQVPLEGADDTQLRRLERRLRGRALRLVPPEEVKDSDPRFGIRLTRPS